MTPEMWEALMVPVWVMASGWLLATLAGAWWFGVRSYALLRPQEQPPPPMNGATVLVARDEARWEERLYNMSKQQTRIMEAVSNQLVDATQVDQELVKLIRHLDDRLTQAIELHEETSERVRQVHNMIGSAER